MKQLGETPALPVNGETVEVMIEDNAFDQLQ